MLKEVKVLKVWHSKYSNSDVMEYLNGSRTAAAAVAEELSLVEGDTVVILCNKELNYKGFDAVALFKGKMPE